MRKLVTITLLIAIFWQNSATLWIMGSFYIQRDYIAQNLCVNRFETIPVCKGSCFLNDELKKAEKQEKKFPNLNQKEIQLFFQQEHITQLKPTIILELNKPFHYRPDVAPASVFHTIDHPPELA